MLVSSCQVNEVGLSKRLIYDESTIERVFNDTQIGSWSSHVYSLGCSLGIDSDVCTIAPILSMSREKLWLLCIRNMFLEDTNHDRRSRLCEK